MQLRSGQTTVATLPCIGRGDGKGEDMNASLCGDLLSLIYAKLPLGPFFRLRQVCKEWNRLASDRQFLESNFKPPISDLYFVVALRTGHRLWTFQDSSWISSPLPRRRCEVSGLLYEDSDRHRVFDLHTRMFYSLPPLPSGKLVDARAIVGMTVDTTVIPYGFRVVFTGKCGTNIYDSSSGAWTTPTISLFTVAWISKGVNPTTISTIHYKNFLYVLTEIWGGLSSFSSRYDLEKHVWAYKLFEFPPPFLYGKYSGIGLWRDRWFAFGMNPEWVPAAIEMHTNSQESWTMFDSMPKDLCKWMLRDVENVNVRSTFCGEHVLVYDCWGIEEKAILYNLDQKTWEKITLQRKCRNCRFQNLIGEC